MFVVGGFVSLALLTPEADLWTWLTNVTGSHPWVWWVLLATWLLPKAFVAWAKAYWPVKAERPRWVTATMAVCGLTTSLLRWLFSFLPARLQPPQTAGGDPSSTGIRMPRPQPEDTDPEDKP